MTSAGSREFQFSDRDFQDLRKLVLEHTGISLSDMKRDMVYARLVRRVRKLNLPNFKAYRDLLHSGGREELVNFVNAITTNLTSFFREPHQLELLAGEILPELMEQKHPAREIRIWSAGCSTGQEPYSIAMVANEVIPASEAWDVKILATDLDTDVLETARSGVYALDKLDGLTAARRNRFFWKGKGKNKGSARTSSELRDLISFRQLNLMGDWPFGGQFDVIFCRNVIIYFDQPTRAKLFARYADMLPTGGYLLLGHSETLTGESKRFEFIGRNVYRKTD